MEYLLNQEILQILHRVQSTIETVLRRNKPDGSGKHPWKAEATEGEKNVPDSVITGWYKSVYEPTFTAKSAETGK